jgi:hypothetical protein
LDDLTLTKQDCDLHEKAMIAPLLRRIPLEIAFGSRNKEIGFVLQGNQVCIQTDRYLDLLSRRRKVSYESARRSINRGTGGNALGPFLSASLDRQAILARCSSICLAGNSRCMLTSAGVTPVGG